jgi:DNA invertase Pin-like site-specific DNA recombinase
MMIGYARISTHDQNLELQQDALAKASCEKIFTDIASGGTADRNGLSEALAHLRSGDTLVVWRLDRLGRSLKHLIETVTGLHGRGIGFRSLTEGIETETSGGRLVFHLFACLAEFEREVIRERTRAVHRAHGREESRDREEDACRFGQHRRRHSPRTRRFAGHALSVAKTTG